MTLGLTVNRIVALLLVLLAIWQAWRFPVAAPVLTVGLGVYALLLMREIRVWLLLLPAVLGGLSLGFWSGRYFWDASDLFLLVTVAGGLWSVMPWWPNRPVRLFWPVILLFGVQLLFTLRGLLPLETPAAGNWEDYFASTNALREAKGYLWALLLLPMLLQAQRAGGVARWLVGGCGVGMLVVSLSILWERKIYTGVLNFQSPYRVSGLLFDMVTGGAAIDAVLAMCFPFALGLWIWWRRPAGMLLSALLSAMAIYATYVTYSRANYPALAATFGVLAIGWYVNAKAGQFVSRRPRLLRIGVAAVLLAMVPLLFGGVIAQRFHTTLADIQTRLDHWQRSSELVISENDRLLGLGKGVYPRMYHLDSEARGEHLATVHLYPDKVVPYVRFSSSDEKGSLYLRQRIRDMDEVDRVRLRMRLRTPSGTQERLLIEFCERHVLRVRAECAWQRIKVDDTKGEWRSYNVEVDLSRLGRGRPWERSPVDIAILNRGLRHGIDIGYVQLFDAGGAERLVNSDFTSGMDHWFITDGDHLRWHVKNLFLHVYLEGGYLGLGVFVLVLMVALRKAWRLQDAGDPLGTLLMAALLATVMVGLFDSLFDAPRVTLLFHLLLFAAMVLRPTPVAPYAVDLSGRRWRPVWWPRAPHPVLLLLLVVLTVAVGKAFLGSQLSLPQMLMVYGEKAGLEGAWLSETFGPERLPAADEAVSRLRTERPRIWRYVSSTPSGQVASDFWAGRLSAYRSKSIAYSEPCEREGMGWDAVCWVVHADETAGERALAALKQLPVVVPQAYGEYGNGWLHASIYDLLSGLPALDKASEKVLHQRMQGMLRHYLLLLDSEGPAIWHGRTTLAAQALLLASVLDDRNEEATVLVRRAVSHYLRMLNALSMVEAWPEGYNYWINTRAFLVALSAKAYLSAFVETSNEQAVRRLLERVGDWHIHNTRPDLKAVQIGDEGPRIDLKDETRRVIDLIADITRQPRFAAYSKLLQDRFGSGSYYRGYRWQLPLLNDPVLLGTTGKLKDLSQVAGNEPTASWFGQGSMNMFYLRSGWDADATFMSFRAGSSLSHHGHYDAGHFTLFKGAPLAVTGATYRGGLMTGHRLNYGIRTVSKNSLLIMRPGEIVQPDDHFKQNVAAGGQRLTLAVRNPLSDLASWENNVGAGLHLEGGRIRSYEHLPGEHTFIDADLTRAYNTPDHDESGGDGKVHGVQRKMLYLRRLDRLLILDWVDAVHPEYRAKWLLQTRTRPKLEEAVVLKGSSDNGILFTEQAAFEYNNEPGALHVLSLLPRQRKVLAIGGRSFRFLADVDGNADTLDGQNMGQDSRITDWFEPALWRIEISDAHQRAKQRFLTLLSPSVGELRRPDARLLTPEDSEVTAAQVDDEVLVFLKQSRAGGLRLDLRGDINRLRIFGLLDGAELTVNGQAVAASRSGVVVLKGHRAGQLEIAWVGESKDLEKRP